MYRFFLQVIIYFCFSYFSIALALNQNVGASSINESNESKYPTKSSKAALNKSSKPAPKKTLRNSSRMVLVPPPPPEQPSLVDWSNLGIMSESLNMLNEEELKQKLVSLRKEITNTRLTFDENNTEVIEAKDKAERFVSLYSEGVVSRKELEMAQKQVSLKERVSQETNGKVEDLKAQENAILRRLASFKNSKGKLHVKKKKISNGEKQKQ